MIRIFKIAFVLTLGVLFSNCNKTDTAEPIPVIPFAEQYPKDLATIETYLKSHSMTTVNNPGLLDDQDVTFATVTAGDASSIWGSDPLIPKPSLLHKIVNSNGVDYKVYYISLREGTQDKPTIVDSVYVSYRGEYIYNKTEEILPATDPKKYKTYITSTQFEINQNPVWFPLDRVISGWSEIFPLFKSGTFTEAANGSVTFENFGAGVMFLPSGLAYYNVGSGSIPSYSPLIFTFKLKGVNYVDNDYDRIDSRYEDINGNGIYTDDDTDGDGRPNYLDQDDDGDNFLTKVEIRKPTPYLGLSAYYPYNPILDDPATPTIDETELKGIPDKTGDGITSSRLRRHLDPTSKPPFTTY
jgi:FKBP-type peptidyl-prolyl cis-trans isomerase FkpA